jgi:Flp pilus assembly protein TadD
VEKPSYVVGERGFGYRLLGPVEALGPVPPSLRHTGPARSLTRATLVLCALATASLLVVGRPHGGRAPTVSPPRVCVRPFTAPGGPPALAEVAARLTAATTSQIRRLEGAALEPESGLGPPPELRVEGAVRGTTDAATVSLRLVDGATGRLLWARSFRASVYDVLDQAEATAFAVARIVHERIGGSSLLPVSPDAAAPAVRRLCLRADLAFVSWTEEGLRVADEAWREAERLDARHAPAQAGVALAAGVRALLGYESPDRAEPRARVHALRAMELDDRLALTHVAGGLVRLLFDRDPGGAESFLGRAVELQPDELDSYLALALVSQARGRYDESLEYLRGVSGADPRATAVLLLQGRAHQGAGRWGDAVAAYEGALRLEPEFALARRGLAESLAAADRDEEALQALRTEPELAATSRDSHQPAGTRPGTLRDAWRARCAAGGPWLRERVRACLLGGDREQALVVLRAAIEARGPFVVFVVADPAFEPLRGDPRFGRLFQPTTPRVRP